MISTNIVWIENRAEKLITSLIALPTMILMHYEKVVATQSAK